MSSNTYFTTICLIESNNLGFNMNHIIYRLKNSYSLLNTDSSHLYHFLQRLVLNNKKVLLTTFGISSVFLLVGFLSFLLMIITIKFIKISNF